jgi:hypothetical protein
MPVLRRFEARGGQVPPPGEVVAYPAPGMTVQRGTYAVSAENPRPPLGLLPDVNAGTPVLVGFRNEDFVAADFATPRVIIDRFRLTDADGAPVPSVVLADAAIVGNDVTHDRSCTVVSPPSCPYARGRQGATWSRCARASSGVAVSRCLHGGSEWPHPDEAGPRRELSPCIRVTRCYDPSRIGKARAAKGERRTAQAAPMGPLDAQKPTCNAPRREVLHSFIAQTA